MVALSLPQEERTKELAMNVRRRLRIGRGFVPGQSFNAESISLEVRSLATDIPGFKLDLVLQPIQGISSTALTEQSQSAGQQIYDNTNGTENTSAFDSGSFIPNPLMGSATSSAKSTNQLIQNNSSTASFGITINTTMTNHAGQTGPVTGGFWPFSITSTAQNGPSGSAPAANPLTWDFVDTSKSGFPNWEDVGGNPQLYISGTLTLQFSPDTAVFGHPRSGSGTEDLTKPLGNLVGNGFIFNSAAAGVTVVGPVTDGRTGDQAALEVIYPSVAKGGGYQVNTLFYDQYFNTGGSVSVKYEGVSSARLERIEYAQELSTMVFVGGPQGFAGQDQFNFHYGENVAAAPAR